ncbi:MULTISPECIES: ribonuclease H-like domain-containing protein [Xanthomonas]|uniref:ribonuclease H-like domain-containing protein n=1 Tax=Xanthomonas TaxID=338 RepID=UPI00096C678D|nr:ribonuclease H-like domain-containing protein [Xanthomonas campestris]MCC5091460.1 ribonuclease H-like domain-containing protein [Xanthomonas campestris pv. incanae]MDX6083441.1 ribonuclease H-like domain-containing protein [Xanthomonas campestris pv. incanae]MDX6087586.1 ribonuclease H-like domain-containing protein [Xanthomonas campestris pv. incanae]MDX6141082.1 ribonuclease H-like domain-containing protein [Xanthomonas campestris pv. incanae]MEA9611064.1 ribonuclease H-like domain-conta
MSVSADRLRLLRRQAGHADVPAPTAAADGAAADGADVSAAVDVQADAYPLRAAGVARTSGDAVAGNAHTRAAGDMPAAAQPMRAPAAPVPGSDPGVSAERLRLLRRQVGGLTPTARKDDAVMPTRAQRQPAPGAAASGSRALPRDAAVRSAQPGSAEAAGARRAQPSAPAMTRRALQAPVAAAPARDSSAFAWVDHDVRHKPAGAAADAAARVPAMRATPAASISNPPPQRRTDIAGLRKMIGLRERAVSTHAPVRAASTDRHLPGNEIAPGLHLIEAFLPQAIPRQALSLAFAKREDAVDPMDLLFFDTETTGLAGGTGTRAFMIGVADWYTDVTQGSGLRVRQLMMSTMAAESAMLDLFRSWLSPQTVLSSYNGRCYDAPLLKTRYRLARRGDPISALDHVDLLFPTRRRYRGTWENCKLSTIERQLLRVVREDDLPGSEAPAAWLSYLRGGSARNLRRVAEHNHQDVVTLSLLMQRLVAVDAQDREVIPMLETP